MYLPSARTESLARQTNASTLVRTRRAVSNERIRGERKGSFPMSQFYTADQAALQQWFFAVDTDRSGAVNAAELQKAMAQGGLNFSMKLVSSMIRMYDADRTAQLSMQQFIELHHFLVKVQGVFSAADRQRTNQLDLNEIFAALQQLGYNLDRQPGGAFYTLCQSYDYDRTGAIALDSFIAMAVMIENAQKLHKAFDPTKTGRATFDFNQFIWTLALL